MRVKNFFKLLAKILLGLVALLACLIAFVVMQPAYTNAVQIDFTRYIAKYSQETTGPLVAEDAFFGVPGPARLIVTAGGEGTTATIQLNGTQGVEPGSFCWHNSSNLTKTYANGPGRCHRPIYHYGKRFIGDCNLPGYHNISIF